MSFVWTADRLAGICFPASRPNGVMLMLSGYLDDSGTHNGSQVVVWGGLVGRKNDFAKLEQAWMERLQHPLPGKSSLASFHLADCRMSFGEFRDYKPAERDAVRFKFREAIVQAPVMALGFAVDVEAWKSIAPGTALEEIAGPESCAFGLCVRYLLETGRVNEDGMSMYFDQGREGMRLGEVRRGAWEMLPETARVSSFAFLEVSNCPVLQAADTVANEFYHYVAALKSYPNAVPDAHFSSFLGGVAASHFGTMREKEITDLARKMERND